MRTILTMMIPTYSSLFPGKIVISHPKGEAHIYTHAQYLKFKHDNCNDYYNDNNICLI